MSNPYVFTVLALVFAIVVALPLVGLLLVAIDERRPRPIRAIAVVAMFALLVVACGSVPQLLASSGLVDGEVASCSSPS